MKKLSLFLILLFPLICFAQGSPSPSPSPGVTPVPFPTPADSPGLISTVSSLISLARGWQSLGFYAALATLLKLMVDASKLSFLGAPFEKIPEKYRLAIVTGVGTVIVLLGFLAAHVPILMALSAAMGTAVGSSFVHELIKDFIPGADAKPPSES